MSLFGSIQLAGNTLQAMQIGLHVVGNNIANANTPGYIRERTIFAPAGVQRIGNLTLGLGVEVAGIVQSLDKFVEDRLRDVGGDRASADVQKKVYGDLESVLGELTDRDVSTLLTNFFNSVNGVIEQPEELAVRNLVVESGVALTSTLNTVQRRVETIYTDFGRQVENLTSELNTLTEQVRDLNLQITALEGGGSIASQAGGLRSQRQTALKRLAEIADVQVNETPVGAVNVAVGGEFLVFEGTRREVAVDFESEQGLVKATVNFADNGSPLHVAGGELHGVYESRDGVVRGFLDGLDEFAAALAFEFNKIYSQGQGATGYAEVLSEESVDDPAALLDAAGLAFTPASGQFDLIVFNTRTNLKVTHTIDVDLNGLDGDSSLTSVAAAIDAIDGVTASVTADNRLSIEPDSAESRIGFSGDTSGLLAAIGVNTFFTGSGAADIAVNDVVRGDASKFAAASDGIGVGVENAQRLVELHDAGLTSLGGVSITGIYDKLINETAQGATVAASIAEGFTVFEQTLESEAQAVSGVNIDEEAIDMILLQRVYQASAKYIATLSELLDVLVAL